MKRLLTMVLMLLLITAPFTLGAQTKVMVSQESSPYAGDFDDNYLGSIAVFDQSGLTAATVYQYNTPLGASYNGSVTPSIPDTSQIFVVNTSDGVSLFVVHDQPQDGDGGSAQMQLELSGDPTGAARLVEDDPGDASRLGNLSGPNMFQTNHLWYPCCTDGVVIGALDGAWSMLVSFSDVDGSWGNEFVGIPDWVATSADGTTIPLILSVDRRVRLTVRMEVAVDIKPGSCPNPLNTKSKGVLPVAVLGTANFDVTQIDPETVKLAGVAALRWALADVGTPFEPALGKEDCLIDCNEDCGDGSMDLLLNFDRQELLDALGDVEDGECLVLTLEGNLKEYFGGIPIIGEDVLLILDKVKE
jgi:hypothetical protein